MDKKKQTESVYKLVDLIVEIRKIHPRMEVQMLQAVLYLYNNPNAADTDLMAELNLTQGTVSALMWALADYKRHDKPGHGLVIREEDPYDRRKRSSVLSAKGKRFVERLIETIK
jgi:DNA-binding MarR family transcriptional regulator